MPPDFGMMEDNAFKSIAIPLEIGDKVIPHHPQKEKIGDKVEIDHRLVLLTSSRDGLSDKFTMFEKKEVVTL